MDHMGPLLLLAVLSVITLTPSGDHLYAIVNGTFEDSPIFNLTIFALDFRGIILYGIDSRGSELRMEVSSTNTMGGNISLTFRHVPKSSSLTKLCGCTDCKGVMVHFDVAIKDKMVSVTCNRLAPFILSSDDSSKRQKSDDESLNLGIPPQISNGSNQTYVMVVNIGPRETAGRTNVFPVKDQLVGCVNKFIYNQRNVTFIPRGSKVLSSCLMTCNNGICNNGSCIEGSMTTQRCDCRSTALNGRYCNQSLNIYLRGGNNIYERISETKEIYMKMTWKTLLSRNYCLIVIMMSQGRLTISTNGTHLRVDSTVLSNVHTEGLNFLSLNISKDILIIKSQNKESKYTITPDDVRRLYIGFSEASGSCETFVGTYDIYFHEGQLRQMYTTGGTATKTDHNTTSKTQSLYTASYALSVGCLIIFVVVVAVGCIFISRSRREMKMQIEKITAMSTFSLDIHSRIFSETGTYGKVMDNCDYDYIVDPNEFSAENR